MKNLQDIIREYFGKRTIESTDMPDYFATSLNPAFQLRPYQEECFQYFINYWENAFEGKEYMPQLLFHMATGSGKTLIMAGLMLYLYKQGYRNFLFFVNSSNIIEKTKENFLNPTSHKYLFAPVIEIDGERTEVKLVDNFQSTSDDCINLCLTTIQGLHTTLNNPKENAITYDDFSDKKIVLISDEAHHINTSTKKGKKVDAVQLSAFDEESDNWETTVMRIFKSNNGADMPNVLLEFTATSDLTDANIAEKYANKIIFDYPLKKFREDRYSKDIEVVQSDLSPIERAVQTVVLNQYKRKPFNSIGHDIKPVMMLKSKTIADNKKFYNEFILAIHSLKEETILNIKYKAKDDVLSAFTYIFDERGVRMEDFLSEIKNDFKEDNLLLVDGNNITPEKQLQLNTLEAKDNEFRAVFAVDMLNEGWDVLNLFDIVRLYETRDASNNKPGKTTMQEAQLIGRGARYMPFVAPNSEGDKGKRKFDKDIENRLRAVEKLHYHSAHNPRYLSELTAAMEETGIVAKRNREIKLRIKDSFKESKLYKEGRVFGNERNKYIITDNADSLCDDILNKVFNVRIRSGEMQTSIIYGEEKGKNLTNESVAQQTLTLKELGKNILREAINRLKFYNFNKLKSIVLSLSSVEEFISSEKYLADIKVVVSGREEEVNNLSQKQKLAVAVDVLKQMEPMFGKSVEGFSGSKEFKVIGMIKDIFKDKTLKISLEEQSDKEYGKSMLESGLFSSTDLSKCDWYAFDDCYGTSEEKYFVKYFESIVDKLKEKYEEVYLVRNEREVKIYEFKGGVEGGRGFEPDFLLFMKKAKSKGYENYQIFIEPKGNHLKEHDAWKQIFMQEMETEAQLTFTTMGGDTFRVCGMPFYIEDKKECLIGQ